MLKAPDDYGRGYCIPGLFCIHPTINSMGGFLLLLAGVKVWSSPAIHSVHLQSIRSLNGQLQETSINLGLTGHFSRDDGEVSPAGFHYIFDSWHTMALCSL